MSDKFEVRPGRLAGPLLASGLVILLGALGIALTIAAGGGNGFTAFIVFLAIILCTPLIALLFRSRPVNLLASRFGWMTVRDPNDTGDYVPRAMRQRRRNATNHPPTVEEIREVKEGLNNWVPAAGGRSPKKRTE